MHFRHLSFFFNIFGCIIQCDFVRDFLERHYLSFKHQEYQTIQALPGGIDRSGRNPADHLTE